MQFLPRSFVNVHLHSLHCLPKYFKSHLILVAFLKLAKMQMWPHFIKSVKDETLETIDLFPSHHLIPCKILEHILHHHIMGLFDKHNILVDVQHGVCKGWSCDTQLFALVDDLKNINWIIKVKLVWSLWISVRLSTLCLTVVFWGYFTIWVIEGSPFG